jgi:hypothetical protein
MKRYWIEYHETWQPGPMSYWVHRPVDHEAWYEATRFDPAIKPVPAQGFPQYFVEIDGFTFRFASIAELETCVATLSEKHLPSTTAQTAALGTGPGAHWLNKLPARTKSWRYREKAVAYLAKAKVAFEKELASG